MHLLIKRNNVFTMSFILHCLFNTATAQTNDNSDPRNVEIGAGGNIKLESPKRSRLENMFEWHAHFLWESRYITEGRDNLSGKRLYSLSTELTYSDFSFVPWIAEGINTDYSEINLNIIYAAKLHKNLDAFVAYNLIQSRESATRTNDNEISLDLAYFHNKLFYFLATFYYSYDTEGAFSELAIKKSYRIHDISMSLKGILGFNGGYVPNGHNGINNAQIRASFSYHIKKSIEAYAYASYSSAINRDNVHYADDELLRDLFWYGIGISYRF